MKKYTKLSLLLIVLLIASLFTGCNKQEKEFMDAFIKSQEMLSLESTSEVEFNLKAEGLDEETQAIFDGFVNQINDMKLTFNQKSVTNEDQTITKGQIDANIQLTDMAFDSSIWVDMDMSGEKPVLKEIFKLPSMLMGFIPGGAEKEYIVLDFETMSESISNMEEDMPESLNLDETMTIALKYQEKFIDAFVNYVKKYDSNLSVITKLDDKTVDGEKISYYQVAFDDESFKTFLKYTSISMLQDENIIPLFKEYMTEIMKASGEEMPEEFSITENIGEMVQKTKEFFEKLDALTILGKDGIKITYGINEDGYFVSEKGNMNFLINTGEFMDLVVESMKEEGQNLDEAVLNNGELSKDTIRPIFELSVSYDTKIKSINKDVEITFPLTTEENSIDYMELLESMMTQAQQDLDLMVFVDDEFVEFNNEPILVDGSYLVSSRDMAEAFDANITWNEDTKEITIAKDDNQLVFNSKNKQLIKNGKTNPLNTSILIKDGVSYIPVRAVAENLGYTVDWDGDIKMVTIYK